jgi:hypothetical protein
MSDHGPQVLLRRSLPPRERGAANSVFAACQPKPTTRAQRRAVPSVTTRRANQQKAVQPRGEKYSASLNPQISSIREISHPTEGRVAIVTSARWTRLRRARAGSCRADLSVSKTFARTTGDKSAFSISAGSHMTRRDQVGGGCVRQNRVVLAPVAGVKPAEARFGPTGRDAPPIRRRW